MISAYLRKSAIYRRVTIRNISQVPPEKCFDMNTLVAFRPRTENPRVGGSIPPLATIQRKIKHVAWFTCAVSRVRPKNPVL
jgi:hypothetical protein